MESTSSNLPWTAKHSCFPSDVCAKSEKTARQKWLRGDFFRLLMFPIIFPALHSTLEALTSSFAFLLFSFARLFGLFNRPHNLRTLNFLVAKALIFVSMPTTMHLLCAKERLGCLAACQEAVNAKRNRHPVKCFQKMYFP